VKEDILGPKGDSFLIEKKKVYAPALGPPEITTGKQTARVGHGGKKRPAPLSVEKEFLKQGSPKAWKTSSSGENGFGGKGSRFNFMAKRWFQAYGNERKRERMF